MPTKAAVTVTPWATPTKDTAGRHQPMIKVVNIRGPVDRALASEAYVTGR